MLRPTGSTAALQSSTHTQANPQPTRGGQPPGSTRAPMLPPTRTSGSMGPTSNRFFGCGGLPAPPFPLLPAFGLGCAWHRVGLRLFRVVFHSFCPVLLVFSGALLVVFACFCGRFGVILHWFSRCYEFFCFLFRFFRVRRLSRRFVRLFGRLFGFPSSCAVWRASFLLLRLRRVRLGSGCLSYCVRLFGFRLFRPWFGCLCSAGGCYGPCVGGFAFAGVCLLSRLCLPASFAPGSVVAGWRLRFLVGVFVGVWVGCSSAGVSAIRGAAAQFLGFVAAAWLWLVFPPSFTALAFLAGLFCCISGNGINAEGSPPGFLSLLFFSELSTFFAPGLWKNKFTVLHCNCSKYADIAVQFSS